jgi:hypothetical protein
MSAIVLDYYPHDPQSRDTAVRFAAVLTAAAEGDTLTFMFRPVPHPRQEGR